MTDRRNQAICQLNVALKESRLLIWPRVQVLSRVALPSLHRTLQIGHPEGRRDRSVKLAPNLNLPLVDAVTRTFAILGIRGLGKNNYRRGDNRGNAENRSAGDRDRSCRCVVGTAKLVRWKGIGVSAHDSRRRTRGPSARSGVGPVNRRFCRRARRLPDLESPPSEYERAAAVGNRIWPSSSMRAKDSNNSGSRCT